MCVLNVRCIYSCGDELPIVFPIGGRVWIRKEGSSGMGSEGGMYQDWSSVFTFKVELQEYQQHTI